MCREYIEPSEFKGKELVMYAMSYAKKKRLDESFIDSFLVDEIYKTVGAVVRNDSTEQALNEAMAELLLLVSDVQPIN